MTSRADLRQHRTDVQACRDEHERRERTVVDLRMVRQPLEARVLTDLRGVAPAASVDELVSHLDRWLRRHTDGDRELGYLGDAIDDVDLEGLTRTHVRETLLPALGLDGPNERDAATTEATAIADLVEEIDVEDIRDDPFPSALFAFLAAARDDSDDRRTVDAVSRTYRAMLTDGDVATKLRGLTMVGVLVETARLTVVGTSDDGVVGVRTELNERRRRHVAALVEADDRLTGANEPDPYVALSWEDPVAMLPVRLETRFVADDAGSGQVLKVRIYPDQLHVDTHEDQLTVPERDWGVRYWTRLWVAGLLDPTTLLTVDGERFDPGDLRRAEGDLVVPEGLVTDDDRGDYRAPMQLPTQDARETALELLRAFAAEEFSPDPATRYEEVRERAWADGVERFGDERAGYVLDATTPTVPEDDVGVVELLREGYEGDTPPLGDPHPLSFPDVDLRPESWTKTPRARLLPDRFVVTATYDATDGQSRTTDWQNVAPNAMERRDGDEWVLRVTGEAVEEPVAVGPSPEAVAAESGDANAAMAWMTDFDVAEDVGLGVTVPVPSRPDFDPSTGFSTVVVTGATTTMDAPTTRDSLAALLDATDHTEGLELLEPGSPTNNADVPAARSGADDPAASLAVETGPSLVGPDSDGRRLAEALGLPAETFAHVAGADDTRDVDAGQVNRALWPATIGYFVRNLLVPGPGAVEGEGDDAERREREREADPASTPTVAQLLGTGPSETGEGPPHLLRWLETYRDHFVDHVRAGGPFQTLRAGDQPYGVLPVAPLGVGADDRFPADVESGTGGTAATSGAGGTTGTGSGFQLAGVPRIRDADFVPEVVDRVWSLRDEWLDFAENVPSVADDASLSDDDLLSMLAMEATAFSYRRQLWLLGDDSPLYAHAGLDDEDRDVRKQVRDDLLAAGLPTFGPRIADLLFLGASLRAEELPISDDDVGAFADTVVDLFASVLPLVSMRVLGSDDETFSISSLSGHDHDRAAFLDAVDASTDEGDHDGTASLLRQLLRFGALQAAVASRVRLGAVYGWASGEYVTHPAEPTSYGPGDTTVFELLTDSLPSGTAISGNQRLTDHPSLRSTSEFRDVLRTTAADVGTSTPPPDPAFRGFLEALIHLATIDPERLDRLTRETMDLASHRLDAWWTSVATRRLDDHREARPGGVQVGAYGFVEDLAPGSGADAEYLLAPSMDQATTGAVLRSAHAARSREDDPDTPADESAPGRALAVDLSAERVSQARSLLRGVRRGLDLGELLGSRFERGLRVESDARGANLEQYLDDFRATAPSVEGKLDRGDTTVETRTSDVVDGLALYRMWKEGTLASAFTATTGRRSIPSALASAIGGVSLDRAEATGVFPAIHAAMEAVRDVLLTEGLHHLVHGRPSRAAAALEALSRGGPPPELTALDTPRSETGVTHRLLLAFGDAASPSTRQPWRPATRAVLELDDVRDAPSFDGVPERPWDHGSVFDGLDSPVDPADLFPDPFGSGGTGGRAFDPSDLRRGRPGRGPNRFDLGNDAFAGGFDFGGDASDGSDRTDDEDGDDAQPDGGTATATVQVRHRAEPALDEWIGDLLPDPDAVGCTGEFQWERERSFAVGGFETPAEPGTVSVDDVGFEPDVVEFTAVPAGTDDGPAEHTAAGWSQGVFRRAVGDYDEVQRATSVAVDADGAVEHAAHTGESVSIAFVGDAATGGPGTVRGAVVATTADGFEVAFPTVDPPIDGPEHVSVHYRATKLADPTSVRVGAFVTSASEPTDATVVDLVGDEVAGRTDDDFVPDHVTLRACLPVAGTGTGSATNAAVGFAHGEATLTDDGGLDQQSTGVGFDPATDGASATARDDAALAVETGAGEGLRLTVDALPASDAARTAASGSFPAPNATMQLSVSAPGSTTYPGPVLVTFVAVESPRSDTASGEVVHRPSVGTAVAPANDDPLTVRTGFRPGLVEVRTIPGAGSTNGGLPVSTTLAPADASVSLGAATGRVVQRSLSTGLDTAAARASESVSDVGATTTTNDGPVAGVGVGVAGVSDDGFSLSFTNVPDGAGPLVQYRAWPADPASEAFAVPLSWDATGTDGLSLADLDLTPLDAVAITQNVESPGDSQLERRFGYYAFRHRPAARPPVPADATLDLSFDRPSADHDVSVAEYVEVARHVNDLVGQARPADATDLAHPGEADDPGYLPGTARELTSRADHAQGKLATLASLLTNRRDLLSPDPNVCDTVDTLETTVRRFRRRAPVSQVVDVADGLAAAHPGRGHASVTDTVLAELRTVAEHVRAGPTEDLDEALVVADVAGQEIYGDADVSGATDVSVVVRSHADAVRFPTKRDDAVTTDDDGGFSTTFDFGDAPPGTAFTVVVERRGGAGGGPDPARPLLEALEERDEAAAYALLVQLAAAGLFQPPEELAEDERFRRLVRGVRSEFEADVGRWLADDDDALDRRRRLFRDIVNYVERAGVARWFAALDDDERRATFEKLSDRATVRALVLLGRADVAERYRTTASGSGPVFVADGRVVDADSTGGWRDLSAAVADTTYLRALLWLDRALPAFDPDGDGPGADLKATLDDTLWNDVSTERDVMRTTLAVLGHGRADADVLSREDVRAVTDLLSLQALDLAGLVDDVRAVLGPAAWTGLTELVSLTGDPDRPDAQRYWRSGSPGVRSHVPKPPEGEVRARLERLREFPDTDGRPAFAAYSAPVRRLVAEGDVDDEVVTLLEALVAHPAALVDAFGDRSPGLPALLADVHDLLHHTDALDLDTVRELPSRVASFVRSVEAAGRVDALRDVVADTPELADVVDDAGDVVRAFAAAERRLVATVRRHRTRQSRRRAVRTFLRDYAAAVGTLDATATGELADRVLAVTAHDDVTTSFRSGVLESVRHVLWRASYFGVYGSVPASAAGGSADDEATLVAQLGPVLDEVRGRLDRARALDPGGSPTVEESVSRIQALLGDSFVVLPPFAPTNGRELHATLTDDGLLSDPYETDTWLQRAARVRDLPRDFRQVRTYADALSIAGGGTGGLRRTLTPGQLPHVPGQDWLGRDGVAPTGGELSLAVDFANEFAGDGPLAADAGTGGPPVAGLLVDEWVERVPDAEETVGLGLRYDDPSTRAPQSILLAVPPDWERTGLGGADGATAGGTEHVGPSSWTTPLVRQTMTETLDQVRVRSVDLDAFDRFGHLLPMLCFAYNRETLLDAGNALPDAPSVDFNELDWGWF